MTTPSQPLCIQYCGKVNEAELFNVFLEEQLVAECPDLSAAVAVFVAGLYVFNLSYPKESENFLILVTHALMSWDDGQNKTKKT